MTWVSCGRLSGSPEPRHVFCLVEQHRSGACRYRRCHCAGGGTPLPQVAGRITGNDYPRRAYEAGIGGTLFVRYIVGVRGRVTDCTVTRSSGNAELHAATCCLITERFRFKPSRDAAGKPVSAMITEDHTWVVERPPRRFLDNHKV